MTHRERTICPPSRLLYMGVCAGQRRFGSILSGNVVFALVYGTLSTILTKNREHAFTATITGSHLVCTLTIHWLLCLLLYAVGSCTHTTYLVWCCFWKRHAWTWRAAHKGGRRAHAAHGHESVALLPPTHRVRRQKRKDMGMGDIVGPSLSPRIKTKHCAAGAHFLTFSYTLQPQQLFLSFC